MKIAEPLAENIKVLLNDVNKVIKSDLIENEDHNNMVIHNKDEQMFLLKISQFTQFVKKISINFLENFFKSKYKDLNDMFGLLKHYFENLYKIEGKFVYFQF
ncbi:MAG: hypothetical protein JW891_04275 [Candidatus Lokiarchaeota archaeon]|nr:hypothetical protein [Candidatus Lokiarchaeota archaeon]